MVRLKSFDGETAKWREFFKNIPAAMLLKKNTIHNAQALFVARMRSDFVCRI